MNTNKTVMYEEILIEDFLDMYPKCEVLASTDNCLLAINRKTKKAFFHYVLNKVDSSSFTSNLLSHISEEHQKTFIDMINDLGFTLETVETEKDYYNILEY
jgi:Na+-transporting NADH:ubiquinone oxidoreductase subunit NqrA